MALDRVELFWRSEGCYGLNKPRFVHSDRGESYSIAANLHSILGVQHDDGALLLNRLDYETSGILLAVVGHEAWEHWHGLFVSHQIEKEYLALVRGVFPPQLMMRGFQGSRYRGSRKVGLSVNPKKRYLFAESQVNCLSINEDLGVSLVLVRTVYGRRHQVRLHCATLGFPLIGDSLYGDSLSSQEGFFLHAFRLRGGGVCLEVPPPISFTEKARKLGVFEPLNAL